MRFYEKVLFNGLGLPFIFTPPHLQHRFSTGGSIESPKSGVKNGIIKTEQANSER